MDLFGTDDAPWKPELWHAVDDRVRGGASTSALDLVKSDDGPAQARFHGDLDISTLGGAGFASQVYATPVSLPASSFKGLSFRTCQPALDVEKNFPSTQRAQEFVLTLKTQPPERRPDGRLQSRLSFEYHFASTGAASTQDPKTHSPLWKDFVPTYRGRRVAGCLDPAKITEIGIMCRSNFGAQQGPFDLQLGPMFAVKEDRSWLSFSWWCDWVLACWRYWAPGGIRL